MLRWIVALSAIALALSCCKTKADEPIAGLPPELIAKVQEIKQACGSRVVSTYRHGAHKPNGRLSEHAMHKAADVTGNASCIYAHLKGWKGGYSTDYGSVVCASKRGYTRCPHVHISYNPKGREWGKRFAHWRPKHTRLAAVATPLQKEH